MKQIALLILSTVTLTVTNASPGYEFKIEKHWENLEKDSKNSTLFGSMWIWAGTVTFKKRPPEKILLDNLTLQWKGKHIGNLTGTLFRKEPSKPFLPLEHNVVSDGTWNTQKQTFTFPFKKQEPLHPTDTFCLVLAVAKNLETTLQEGSFVIEPKTLPIAFRKSADKKKLSLSCNQTIRNKKRNS